MSLKDQIGDIQKNIKSPDEIAQLEKNLIDAFFNKLAEEEYKKIKDLIISLSRDGRKTFNSSIKIRFDYAQQPSQNEYTVSTSCRRDAYILSKSLSDQKGIDLDNAINAFNFPNSPKRTDNIYFEDGVGDYPACIAFRNLFRIKVQPSFFKCKYQVTTGNIKIFLNEIKRLAELDGVKLRWHLQLDGYGHQDYNKTVDIPFDSEIESTVKFKNSFAPNMVINFSYNID